jgi:hypothetical protein
MTGPDIEAEIEKLASGLREIFAELGWKASAQTPVPPTRYGMTFQKGSRQAVLSVWRTPTGLYGEDPPRGIYVQARLEEGGRALLDYVLSKTRLIRTIPGDGELRTPVAEYLRDVLPKE